jgi:hypothetical protein
MYASPRYLSLLSPDLKTTHLDLFSRYRRIEKIFRTRGMAEISEGDGFGGGRIRIIGQSGREPRGRKGDVFFAHSPEWVRQNGSRHRA